MKYQIIGVMLTLMFMSADGGRIRRSAFGGTVPPGVSCMFNPCKDIQDFCKNQGNCSLNEKTCRYRCICPDGYAGHHCEQTVSSNTTKDITTTSQHENGITTSAAVSILRPNPERECSPLFVCQHGYCNKTNEYRCVCDIGWHGVYCDEKVECPVTCENGQECVIIQNSYMCVTTNTVILPTTTSEKKPIVTSVDTLHPSTANPKMKYTSISFNSAQPRSNENQTNACSSSYIMRPLSERECLPNFVCKFGHCVKKNISHAISLACYCDLGGSGAFCQDTCCLHCSENGRCMKYSNGTEFCSCYHEYRGVFCERKIVYSTPTILGTKDQNAGDKNLLYWNVGICLGLLVLLLVLAVILPYYMWKNKTTVFLKIVYYFQPFEDNDERDWDVFIYYKECKIDDEFVFKSIFSKLENELGFKVCYSPRDFVPEETIINNITNAVNKSRRTLLVLTPRFIKSECQFQQLDILKQKHRIIPIMVEGEKDKKFKMDPKMKTIFKSVPYLEYPRNDDEKKLNNFWERLKLLLPKRRFLSTKL